MERYRRAKGKRALLGSHQKCWIWGRHLVVETLIAGRWPILELCLSQDLGADHLEAAQALAAKQKVPAVLEPPESLTRRCHSSEHQGYLARMSEFPYAGEAEALADAPSPPLLAILDRIQDPHNFGAIIRSAEVFGIGALFVGEQEQVPVTSMVARSSSGAVNRVPIVRVSALPGLAGRLRQRGVSVVAASEKATDGICGFDFRRPVAIVIGNEGRGISKDLCEQCDRSLRIPQHGALGSLNAAVAAAVFFYEARRQRLRQTIRDT
jgi:23S rRNA (guanosine2251-2'-O)-methyltransferase